MQRSGAGAGRVPFWAQCAIASAITLIWVAVLHLSSEERLVQTVSNVGTTAAAFAAAVRCWRGSAQAGDRIRVAWRMIGAGCLSWGAGQVLWAFQEEVLGIDVPFPSIADVGFLGFPVLAVAGLLALPARRADVVGGARAVLDGLIIATALLFISGTVVLEPVLQSGGDAVEQVVRIAYPLSDVVVVTVLGVVFVTTRRLDPLPKPTVALLTAGLVAFATADSGFALQTAQGTYASGNLIDAGWFVGFVLLFLAASRPPAHPDEDVSCGAVRAAALVPYGAVVLGIGSGVVKLAVEGHLGPVLGWTGLVVTSLLVVRQVLTVIENLSLTRDLEGRVRVRTEQLRRSEERFRSLVQHSSDVTTVVDVAGVVRYQSPAGDGLMADGSDELVGFSLLTVVHPDHRQRVAGALRATAAEAGASTVVEYSLLGAGGRWRQVESTITNMLDNGSVEGLVLNTRDVSERRALQLELEHSAFHDPLTKLANRRLFRARLDQSLDAGAPGATAVLFLDLDDFKEINDSYGHEVGDLVLVEVGARLLECVRGSDTVARLGGDEFAVLLQRVSGRNEVDAVAGRICQALRSPFQVDAREVFLAGSVGIASPDGTVSADDLLRNADLAMYRAKAERNGSYRWFEPAMHRSVLRRMEIDVDMRRALDRAELFLEYQPIVDLDSGRITGAEALVRWRHPTRGVIGPAQFIPVAERNGLVAPIGEWVAGEACRQLRRWQDQAPGRPLAMSVNLSGRQLERPETASVLEAALRDNGLDPSQLVLEVTETTFVAQTERALEGVQALKDLGVRLAVDDFGTGYSALSYLHRLPVDVIKIDKVFVDRLSVRPGEAGLAASIVRIGQDLHLVTVAEGVEQAFQLDALRRIGCDQVQGFLLSRPVGGDELGSVLRCGDRDLPPGPVLG